jgi:hypothetical protein
LRQYEACPVLLEHEPEGAVRAVVDAQGTGEDVAAEQKLDVLAISGIS